jgi:hypothetical protein
MLCSVVQKLRWLGLRFGKGPSKRASEFIGDRGARRGFASSAFCDENGRERRITTKETNSKKAPKIAEEFERVSLRRKT